MEATAYDETAAGLGHSDPNVHMRSDLRLAMGKETLK
jgi:hypothetical protein